ncbi:hypothetical protein BDD43_4462 [Mucilaginibacter gracilis]|uniref:Uncharacterized protein n=1 Tax=Mucilaginibacter gracilis TaxID=423350 RepID=A0A495J6J0_9SPHI|nr:hypothetical protein [Mucilaginibacter gracilis]RKR84232.1 hypothetical protein BDD43_4462 [Mucilaginibacter gracilis]
MIEPFDIEIGETVYAVFPEEDEIYTIFKDGIEYVKIQKDTEGIWLKLDPETEMPTFGSDEEINNIGKAIILYQENGGGDEEDEDEEEFE